MTVCRLHSYLQILSVLCPNRHHHRYGQAATETVVAAAAAAAALLAYHLCPCSRLHLAFYYFCLDHYRCFAARARRRCSAVAEVGGLCLRRGVVAVVNASVNGVVMINVVVESANAVVGRREA